MQGIALLQMLQRERRTGTGAQKTFEPHPVGGLDTHRAIHRAIHREAAVVRPGAHLCGVIFVDLPTFDEGAQDAGSHAGLGRGYALSGDAARDQLLPVARTVYEELNAPALKGA